jgi:predicted permease
MVDLEAIQRSVRSIEGAAGITVAPVWAGGDVPVREYQVAGVTDNYFSLLGVRPLVGQILANSIRDAHTAVLSERVARRDFGSAPAVIGKAVTINRVPYRVIGVLPSSFTGGEAERIDIWVPLADLGPGVAGPAWRDPDRAVVRVIARIKSETSRLVVEQEIAGRLATNESFTRNPPRALKLGPLSFERGPNPSSTTSVAKWLSLAGLLLLLIAITNAMGLMFLRLIKTQRDRAIHLALGASTGDLTRRLAAEWGLLIASATIAGLALSRVGFHALYALLQPSGLSEVPSADLRLAAIGALSGVLGFAIGVVGTALHTERCDPSVLLNEGRASESRTSRGMRFAVLTCQVALTVVLAAAAGLFGRSLMNLGKLRLGLDSRRVILVTFNPNASPIRTLDFNIEIDKIRDQLVRNPRIESVSASLTAPFYLSMGVATFVHGRNAPARLGQSVPHLNAVSGSYFRTLGTKLIAGRWFSEADRDNVVMVNQTMASALWSSPTALGQCIQLGDRDAPCREIVGVVEDTRRFTVIPEDPTMQIYIPLHQNPFSDVPVSAVLVKAREAPHMAQSEVQKLLANQTLLPTPSIRLLDDVVGAQIRSWRSGAAVFSVLTAAAILLAVIGIMSMVAFSVTQGRHEMAVRIALGASPSRAVLTGAAQGVVASLIGAVVGIAIIVAASESFQVLLFDVSARDVRTLSVTTASVLIAATLASLIPARQIAHTDPATTLRAS